MPTAAILTISDRCANGEATDASGPVLIELVTKLLPDYNIQSSGVADEISAIRSILTQWRDAGYVLAITTGGTGLAPRDVTPEAVSPLITKPTPGLVHLLLQGSLTKTPLAALSRPVCGIATSMLILTFPGSPKACRECFEFLTPVLHHALNLLQSDLGKIAATHKTLQQSDQSGNQGHKHENHGPSHSHSHDHSHHHHHHHYDHPPITPQRVADRNRKSPYPMMDMAEAVACVLSHAKAVDKTEQIPISSCLRHVVATTIFAPSPIPEYPASVKV